MVWSPFPPGLPSHSASTMLAGCHSFVLAVLCPLHSLCTCAPTLPSAHFSTHIPIRTPILQVAASARPWCWPSEAFLGPSPALCHEGAELCFQGITVHCLSVGFDQCEVLVGSGHGLRSPGYSSSSLRWTAH